MFPLSKIASSRPSRDAAAMRAAMSVPRRPFLSAPVIAAFSGLVFAAPLAHAGQGLYLDVLAYMPSASMTIDSVQCMDGSPQPVLMQRQYVEASDAWSCLYTPSTFSLSIWSAARKVASYAVTVSAWGSRVESTGGDPAYLSIATMYPRFGVLGSQDVLNISSTDLDLASWMQGVNPSLQIRQLDLPGTHDSGTSDIEARSPVTPDASPAIARAAEIAPGLIAGWSRAQSVDVAGQLQRGIRYLDLRLCGGSDVDTIVTCHAMAGQSFTDVVGQVKAFVSAHPTELVIMDMNHWYPAPGTELNVMRNSVYQYLQAQLGPMLAGRDHYDPSSTLGTLQTARRTVIAATDQPMGYAFLWTSVNTTNIGKCGASTDICSYWPESAQLDQQKQRLTAVLDDLRSRPHPYLFVLQTQLTPDLDTILKGLGDGKYSNLKGFTGSYEYGMRGYLDTPHLFDGLSGLIFIQDFSNGIDLTHRVTSMMGS